MHRYPTSLRAFPGLRSVWQRAAFETEVQHDHDDLSELQAPEALVDES